MAMFTSFIITFFLAIVSPSLALQHDGFTTDLIHRDSPLSPSYNPTITKWDRLGNAVQRSISRINHFKPAASSQPSVNNIQATVTPGSGEYLMEFSVGNPPVRQMAIADTGSDLIWFQCQPCLECYKQTLPIFDTRKSHTYKLESCTSRMCDALDQQKAPCSTRNTCKYEYRYGDASHTNGDLATETLTFKSGGAFPNVAIGCGHDNVGTFQKGGSGLVGLGGGPLSLVSQLSSSIGGKFSYCLIPFYSEGNFTSKINFGSKGTVSGPQAVSTPLVKSSPDTFYFLTLEAMTVGKDDRVSFTTSASASTSASTSDYSTEEGNIIIDSGTTLTLLPQEFFFDLTDALGRAIQGQQIQGPTPFQLCYDSSNAGEDLNIPDITAHFKGADLELKPVNTFIEVAKNTVCLAMLPAQDMAIFGNIAQGNFLVGYDTEEGKVTFKPTDCAKA